MSFESEVYEEKDVLEIIKSESGSQVMDTETKESINEGTTPEVMGGFSSSADDSQDPPYKRKDKKRKLLHFIENAGDRARRFTRRSGVIIQTAKELVVQTAAKVNVRMEFKAERGVKILTFPEENLTEPNLPSLVESNCSSEGNAKPEEGLKLAVKEGVKEAFTEYRTDQHCGRKFSPEDLVTNDEELESDASMCSVDSSASWESRLRRKTSNPGSCFICKGSTNIIQERFDEVESEFVRCSVSKCKGKAHYDCLGVPQLGPNDGLHGKWFCNLHVGIGRSLTFRQTVPSTATGETMSLFDPSPSFSGASVVLTDSTGTECSFMTTSGTQRPSSGPKKKRGRPPKTAVGSFSRENQGQLSSLAKIGTGRGISGDTRGRGNRF